MIKQFKITGIWIVLYLLCLQSVHSAPMLRIVGSSAVFPFAAIVAEHFHYKTHEPIPLVEAIGTGAGIKLFCDDPHGPDGVIASRPLTTTEEAKCQRNGITFVPFVIGQDGLVLIQSKNETSFSLTLHDLDQALSEKLLKEKQCVTNAHKTWKESNSTLPSRPIRVLGPAPSSGTYDILVEKIGNACGPILRHDGAYIETAANENLIIQKVLNAPDTIGIVTFSFYDQNQTHLNALPLDGIMPSLTTIQDGSYLLSRPLYLYVKTNGLENNSARRAYALEFTSPAAVGDKGYLTVKGLIPLSIEEQKIMHDRAGSLGRK